MVTIISGLALLLGGVLFVLRMLWNIRGAWDQTNASLQQTNGELAHLVGDVKELVAHKDSEHAAIRADLADRQARGDREHQALAERLTWLERRELQEYRRADRDGH